MRPRLRLPLELLRNAGDISGIQAVECETLTAAAQSTPAELTTVALGTEMLMLLPAREPVMATNPLPYHVSGARAGCCCRRCGLRSLRTRLEHPASQHLFQSPLTGTGVQDV